MATTTYSEFHTETSYRYNVEKIAHHGFEIQRIPPNFLYRIKTPAGKSLTRALDSWFTAIELVKKQIDTYLSLNPCANSENCWIEPPKKRGRGRPRKNNKVKAVETHRGEVTADV